MNILQLGKFWRPYMGGIERIVENLSIGLADAGHPTQVIVSAPTDENISLMSNLKLIKVRHWGNLFSQPLSLIPSFKRLSEVPQLVHIHLPNPLWALQIANFHLPIVITIHADLAQSAFRSWVNDLLQMQLLKKADAIVFTSEWNLKSTTKNWKQSLRDKSQVIPLGVRIEVNDQTQPAPIPDEGFILFVGRWVSYKGLQVLLRACADLPWKLILVGQGPLEAELQDLVRDLKMESRCVLIKEPNDSELYSLYRNCALVVLPSLDCREGFGLTIVEGGFRRKPFIVSDLNSGVQDLLCSQGGLSFKPGDTEDLKEKIRTLMEDPGLRSQMGNRAEKYFRERFTIPQMVKKYEALYQSILKS